MNYFTCYNGLITNSYEESFWNSENLPLNTAF